MADKRSGILLMMKHESPYRTIKQVLSLKLSGFGLLKTYKPGAPNFERPLGCLGDYEGIAINTEHRAAWSNDIAGEERNVPNSHPASRMCMPAENGAAPRKPAVQSLKTMACIARRSCSPAELPSTYC